MRRFAGLSVLLAWVLALSAPPARAADTLPPSVAVIELIHKMQAAAREMDYAGVFTYQQGTTMQSSRVVHLVDGTGERERLEMLDGAPREFIRHNDTVQCLLPEKKLIIAEQQRADRFPGFLLGQAKQIGNYYTFEVNKSHNRVSGRECTMIEVIPKDGQRYGYRLCIDTKTNLLLKAQTLHGNELIDQIAFTSLQVGQSIPADQLIPQWNTQGWKLVQVSTEPVDIAALGWRVSPPPGFDFIMQVSRPMPKQSGKPVKQLVMSDGIAAISVFIEAFDPSHSVKTLPKGAARNGAINIYGTQIGAHWLTAIGEVPSQTLRELAERSEYVPPPVEPK